MRTPSIIRILHGCGTKSRTWLFPCAAGLASVKAGVGGRHGFNRPISSKKKAATAVSMASAKRRPRVSLPDYCDVEPQRDENGNIVWPAPQTAMQDARAFIREAASTSSSTSSSSASTQRVLLVPDKDADGLSAGVIVHRTLVLLGLDPSLIDIHLVQKGSNIHEEDERLAMAAKSPAYIIVLDQGSRGAPRVIDCPSTKSLIIDHHFSHEFPAAAQVVSACQYPPVATTSLLAYTICKDLASDIAESCSYLACIGTHGDLGNALKWLPPFPSMDSTFKAHTKKAINDAVSLINAPRRTAKYDVMTAWQALLSSSSPKDILNNARLQAARMEINQEVERNAHTAPKFSRDGRIAVLQISSKAQVHPVIATRWAGYLNSKALEIVMCANAGYLPGKVNFSCRIARCARSRHRDGGASVNIIESLQAAADLSPDGLRDRMGENFARGHKEASGGIVPTEAFEEFIKLLGVGEKPEQGADENDGKPRTKKQKWQEKSRQKNTLGNYFKKM